VTPQFGVQAPAPAAQPQAQPKAAAPPAAPAAAPAAAAPAEKPEQKKAEEPKTPAAPPAAAASGAPAAPAGNLSLASLSKTNKIEIIPRSPDKPPHPKSGEAAQKFVTFCEVWLKTLTKNYIHTANNVEIVDKDGKYVARYTAIDMSSVKIELKESAYDHTPFVGLLKYSEQQMEAAGDTPAAAKAGKFAAAKRIGVTEIFRYTKDHWIE